MLHSCQVVLVQETPKAGVTGFHKLNAGTHVLLDLAYSDRKHDSQAVLSTHRPNYTACSCFDHPIPAGCLLTLLTGLSWGIGSFCVPC